MMGHNRKTKVTLVTFPLKFSFSTTWKFGPNFGQNYAILCLMSYDSLNENFEMLQYGGIRELDQSNVSQLTTKFFFRASVIWTQLETKFCYFMSHDSLSDKFYEIL